MAGVVFWMNCAMTAIFAFLAIAERKRERALHFLTFFLASIGGIFLLLNNAVAAAFYLIVSAALVFLIYFRSPIFKTKDLGSETAKVGFGKRFLSAMFGVYLFFMLLTVAFAGSEHVLKISGLCFKAGIAVKIAAGSVAPLLLVMLGFFVSSLTSFKERKL